MCVCVHVYVCNCPKKEHQQICHSPSSVQAAAYGDVSVSIKATAAEIRPPSAVMLQLNDRLVTSASAAVSSDHKGARP